MKTDQSSKELGFRIKEAREKKKLTQSEVAEKSDMTVTYYAMIERGEVNPSVGKLRKILKVLNLKIVLEG
jgi:transcriptional regulator with XRE-family HTH domain